jgi:hypothetical protein
MQKNALASRLFQSLEGAFQLTARALSPCVILQLREFATSSGRFVKTGVTQTDTVKEEKLPREKGNSDGDGTDGLISILF